MISIHALRLGASTFIAIFAGLGPAADVAEPLTPNVAEGLVENLASEVAQLRGLAFKRKVSVEVVDDAHLRRYVMTRLKKFDQLDRLNTLQQTYRLLGLVPEDVDVLDVLLEVMEEQAGGFYDPGSETYYLLDDMPAATAPIFTVHELTHALEDQHYDLDRRLEDVLADDDRALAVTAVHEGSAMVLMSVYMLRAAMRGDLDPASLMALAASEAGKAEKLSELPPVLQRQLLGPYILGANFLTQGNLLQALSAYPVESAEQVLRDGPTSSEQILHPDRYWNAATRDQPTTVRLDGAGRLLGRRFKLEGEGVLGELSLGPLVGAATPIQASLAGVPESSAWTNDAATGWDGDRWELWVHDERAVLLLLTVWDSAQDATEFADALPPGRLRWKRNDEWVAIVAGDAGKKTARLLARMLESPTEN